MIKVSILIPAYREEKNIQRTLSVLQTYLEPLNFEEELIVICDGRDDRTFEYAQKEANEKTRIFSYQFNQGKGYALKYGFKHSSGDLIVFFDAGLDFPPEDIRRFVEYYQKEQVPVIIGSKRHPNSKVNYPLKRRLISLGGQIFIRLLFNFNVRDTQVGLKLFRRDVLENIFPRILVKRYALDIELLALAHHYGYDILEAPINLNLNLQNGSGVSLKAIWDCFWDTCAVFYRLKILRYYNQAGSKPISHPSSQAEHGLD